MPVRAPWQHRLVAVVAALAVTLGSQALVAPSAGAAGVVAISGSGSTWASNALDQWRRDLSDLEGMTVSFSPDGSTNGRSEVRAPAGAKATATTFMVIPSGPVVQGTPVILVAQVAPANAAGTIQFMDGDADLGPPRPVFGGFALAVTSKLAKGAHALTAVFTASNQDAFGPSAPPPVSLTVIGLS